MEFTTIERSVRNCPIKEQRPTTPGARAHNHLQHRRNFWIVGRIDDRLPDDRRNPRFQRFRQPNPQLDAKRRDDFVGDKLPRSSVQRINATNQLARQESIRERVVSMTRSNRPVGLCCRRTSGNGVPVENFVHGEWSVDAKKPTLMADQLGHGGLPLPVFGELRPVRRHEIVVAKQTALDQHRQGNGHDALGGGEHQLQCGLVVRCGSRFVEETAAQVNDLLTPVINRHGGTDLFGLGQVVRKGGTHRFPSGRHGSSDIGHALDRTREAHDAPDSAFLMSAPTCEAGACVHRCHLDCEVRRTAPRCPGGGQGPFRSRRPTNDGWVCGRGPPRCTCTDRRPMPPWFAGSRCAGRGVDCGQDQPARAGLRGRWDQPCVRHPPQSPRRGRHPWRVIKRQRCRCRQQRGRCWHRKRYRRIYPHPRGVLRHRWPEDHVGSHSRGGLLAAGAVSRHHRSARSNRGRNGGCDGSP